MKFRLGLLCGRGSRHERGKYFVDVAVWITLIKLLKHLFWGKVELMDDAKLGRTLEQF